MEGLVACVCAMGVEARGGTGDGAHKGTYCF